MRLTARRGVVGRLFGGTLELVAVLALTLAFFGCFLVLMGAVFPAGESLRTLVLQNRQSADLASFEDRPGTPVAGRVADAVIASLDVLRPDVRRRVSETITWDPAHSGEALRDQDAVQTGANGRALVRFGTRSEMQLERNSLVVVAGSRFEPGGAAGERRNGELADDHATPLGAERRGIILMQGELLATLQAPEHTRIELSIPNVIARLPDTTSRTPARFRVTVRKDRSATVSVLDGRLNLESRSGVVSIGPRQFSHVTLEGEISAPLTLPGAPSDCLPAEGSTYVQLDLPPRVTFAWSDVPGAGQYRIRAARDPGFRDIALDETVPGDSLSWGRAAAGTYWWQVAGVVDGVEGVPTRARTMVVRQDVLPPQLVVQAPPNIVRERRLSLHGAADPRAHLYVMGRPAEVGRDGSFQIDLELEPGANVLVVEAVDAAGHTSYWSQVVHLKT